MSQALNDFLNETTVITGASKVAEITNQLLELPLSDFAPVRVQQLENNSLSYVKKAISDNYKLDYQMMESMTLGELCLLLYCARAKAAFRTEHEIPARQDSVYPAMIAAAFTKMLLYADSYILRQFKNICFYDIIDAIEEASLNKSVALRRKNNLIQLIKSSVLFKRLKKDIIPNDYTLLNAMEALSVDIAKPYYPGVESIENYEKTILNFYYSNYDLMIRGLTQVGNLMSKYSLHELETKYSKHHEQKG